MFIIRWKGRKASKAQHQEPAKTTDYESLDNKEKPTINDNITTEITEENNY